MKKLVYFFFMLPVISFGQGISCDFEDSDLTGWFQYIPEHWCLSEDEALSGAYSLMHCYDDTVAGKDWIAYMHEPLKTDEGNCSWEFMIRYGYKPSAANTWSVFIAQNKLPDEAGNVQEGLVLGVNYEGHTDELMIWQKIEDETTILLNTGFDWESNIDPGKVVCLRLTRNISGYSELEIDTAGTGFSLMGNFMWETDSTLNTFILWYKYTATHDRELSIDNILINGKFEADATVPKIDLVEVNNPNELEIQFSEPVLVNPGASWSIDEIGFGSFGSDFSDRVVVNVPNSMVPGNTYIINLPAISDVYGNSLPEAEKKFSFYYPKSYDVLITEIMADPTPPVTLPEAEYIELFNSSSKKISIRNWTLSVNGHSVKLPYAVLDPAGYVTLSRDYAQTDIGDPGQIITVRRMPALNNAGALISLQDRSGKLIHAVNYTNGWYAENSKDDGGWSLEMVDPSQPCIGSSNWRASIDYRGGTPGEQNSIFDLRQVNRSPGLWRSAVTDSGTLVLYFSEPLDSNYLCSPQFYSVDHEIGEPVDIKPAWPFADKLELIFSTAFKQGIDYSITLSSDICDCSGKYFESPHNNIFSVPSVAGSGNIIINEVMYDPEDQHIEYIEIYNPSIKTIDLRNFMLSVGDQPGSAKPVTSEYWPIRPGSYAVIASGYRGIDQPGIFEKADRVICFPGMPVLSNTGNYVSISNADGKILDRIYYSPDMHHTILSSASGVSLERIASDRSGLDPGNWQSASSDAGYKTPAAENSQQLGKDNTVIVTVEPEVITPDADGLDDELSICYKMDLPGYMARIIIFDIEGKKQYSLANGALLGTQGCYTYVGRNENGHLLATGYYIVYFEAYNELNDRYVLKKAFVVAR